ncbi:MAG: DUF4832 domain-containing protein [Candidatus Glassbacteria bacterium]|nr:DUF4832 domain-containing protein [Candidatus Glassbacteria bacterium]
MKRLLLVSLCLLSFSILAAQDKYPDTTLVRPVEIDSVLVNPGIGFMTFQRFNGDTLNAGSGWTEAEAIVYQDFDGDLTNPDYPAASTAYFRVYWKFLEPEEDKYNWDIIDKALKTAAERGQTLLLRIAPYGSGPERDVPGWVRELFGKEEKPEEKKYYRWRVDADDPRYIEHFTDMVHDLGDRYDGHPDLELVDMSLVGYWGEGAGSAVLQDKTRKRLVDAYLDAFKKTHKVMLLTDEKTNKYGREKGNVGWRVDCIGDLGFWAKDPGGWTHMWDYYPQGIIDFGMADAWKTAPVTLEICGTLLNWRDKQGYNLEQVRYIFDQSLKWHISSFNAKSSAVPPEWWPEVNRWLNKMGYRFVLRRISYPDKVRPHGKLGFRTWWENKGVAPIYREYTLALRMVGKNRTEEFYFDEDMRGWLPGDIIWNDAAFLPVDMPEGDYELQIGILDKRTRKPAVQIAIEGRRSDGWYPLGKIAVKEDSLK